MRTFIVALAALTLVGITACGSSDSSNSSSNTTAASSSGTTASGSDNGASSVEDFASDLQKGKDVEFDATYESRPSSGDTSTFRVAQKKPKSLFETKSGDSTTTIINDGTTTYVCSKSGSDPANCFKQPGGNSNSVAAPMLALVDPNTISASLRALGRAPGVDVSRSSKTIAGEKADCVTVKVSGQGNANDGTWCVLHAGVLASVESAGNVVELTKFTSDVSDSTFEPPGDVQG